jgi:putative salt-induced outer membrane protein YdiY
MPKPAYRTLCIVLAFLALLRAPSGVLAAETETLYLRNGKQLSGISRGVENGLMRWEMPHGETITIPLDDIDRIEHRVPPAPLAEPSEREIEQPPPAEGKTAASGENDPGGTDPSATKEATDAPTEETIYEMGSFERLFGNRGAPFFDRAIEVGNTWTKRLEIGGRLLSGNTEENFFNTALLFEKTTERFFTQIDAGGQYSAQQGNATSNRWFLNGNMDFNKRTEEKWVWFASSKNEHDEFENLLYRGTLSTGIGYRFFKEPKRRLITRLGPGVTYELFTDPPNNRVSPDLFGEIESVWPLFDRTSIEHKTSIYPSLQDIDVFRFVSTSGLLIALDEGERWMLKLGLRHEFNSQPNPSREKSDYTASVLLVYSRN